MSNYKLIQVPTGHPYADIAGQLAYAIDCCNRGDRADEIIGVIDVIYAVLERWIHLNGIEGVSPEALLEVIGERARQGRREWIKVAQDVCGGARVVGRIGDAD